MAGRFQFPLSRKAGRLLSDFQPFQPSISTFVDLFGGVKILVNLTLAYSLTQKYFWPQSGTQNESCVDGSEEQYPTRTELQ